MASALSLEPLEIIHKRIVRIITKNLQNTHTSPLFQKLNLLKLNDITIEIAKKVFMSDKNPEVPEYRCIINCNTSKKIEQTHNYNARLTARCNYLIQKTTDYGKKTFSYIGPQIWQIIPTDLKALNYNRFKIQLIQ